MFNNLLKKAKNVIKKSSDKKEDNKKNQKDDLSYKEKQKPKVNIGIRG